MSIVVLSVVGVVVGAAVHLAMLFFNSAPSNPLSRQHTAAINNYVAPEFAQQWKFFAPNPMYLNSRVQARAEVLMPDGTLTTTRWVDLTAMDEARIVHNPFPSQAHQNELTLVWTNFVGSLDNQGRPIGKFGNLMQRDLQRIAAHRLGQHRDNGTVLLVQMRSANTPMSPPWSHEHVATKTSYLVLPWWFVKAEDFK